MSVSKAYNMDCMEALKDFPDGYFELCIADPPYGINVTGRHRSQSIQVERESRTPLVGGGGRPFGGKKAQIHGGDRHGRPIADKDERRVKKCFVESTFYPVFDDSSPPDADTFRELKRVSKKLIIWGGNFFLDHLASTSCMIVWDKKRRGMDQADCEIAWTNLKGQSRIFEYKWNGMLQEDMKNKEARIHATQKPVALYKWLLMNFAEQGDKILDPYLGSGSSRIAAYDMSFDFYGYELSKVYFDLQEERFAKHTAQENLFLMEGI